MSEIVYSPLEGTIEPLTEVPDEMFAQKMLGDGMAIIPSGNKVYSPVNGVVTLVYETKHAIGLKTDDGLEVLIHMGIDTVSLKGKPFKIKAKVDQRVSVGDLLAVVNWKYIEKKGLNTVVPVIVMGADHQVSALANSGKAANGQPLFEVA